MSDIDDTEPYPSRRRSQTERIVDEPTVIVDLELPPIPTPPNRKFGRGRTAIGTTPPALRLPDWSDGVPHELAQEDTPTS